MREQQSQEQRDAIRARRRVQFESKLDAMELSVVQARLPSLRDPDEQAWARAWIRKEQEKVRSDQEAERTRAYRADQREEALLKIERENSHTARRAFWVSIAALIVALIALFR